MNKLKLGLDIDSVVCEILPDILEEVNKKFGKDYTKESITDWYMKDGDFDLYQEIMAALDEKDVILNLPTVIGAIPAIKFLKGEFDIHFITTRPPKYKQYTRTWIINHLPLRRSEFTLHHVERDKNGIGVDILVDDNFGNVFKFASSEKPAILYTQPWNTPGALATAKVKYEKARIWSIDKPDSAHFKGYPIYRSLGWFNTCNLIFEISAVHYGR